MQISHPNFKDENGNIYLIKCPECKYQNYALNVAHGICAWCGFDANEEDEEKKKYNADSILRSGVLREKPQG